MKRLLSIITVLAMVFAMTTVAHARLVGDVNKDDTVNSLDALDVLMHSVGKLDTIDIQRADVNKDGIVNAEDALSILYITVGSYTGELEVEDEDVLITSYKKDVIDPIVKSGEFTIKTTVISDGKSVPSTVMVRGNDLSTDITYDGFKCRLLILNGKGYMLLPDFHIYAELNSISVPTSITGSATDTYTKSEYYEQSGKTYICEIYTSTDGSVRKYYFLDGVWKAVETTVNGETSTQRIDSLKKGVTASNFSLSGYIKVADLSKYV